MIKTDVRNRFIPALLLVLACVFASLTGPVCLQEAIAQQLTILEADHPNSTDPYTAKGEIATRFFSLYCRPLFIYEHIIVHGPDAYREWLAEPGETDWFLSEDSSETRLAISRDAWFYRVERDPYKKSLERDSSKVTAYDVVTTYKNLVNPNSALGSTWYADRLRKHVKDMKAVHSDTVLITFADRTKGYIRRHPEEFLDFPIVPREGVGEGAIETNPRKGSAQYKYMEKPWGSGPFVLKDIGDPAKGKVYSFERTAPDYTGRGEFQTIVMRVLRYDHLRVRLESGEYGTCVPSVPMGLRQEVNENSFIIKEMHCPSVEQFMFNTRHGPLSEQQVRAALSLFIDRKTLVNEYGGETDIINGPMPRDYPFYCEDCRIPYYRHDPQEARSMLEDAGFIWDSKERCVRDGNQLKLEIIGYSGTQNSIAAKLVHAVSNGWEQEGIDATAKIVSPKTYWEKVKSGDFDVAFSVLTYNRFPEMDRHFVTGGAENYSGFSDPMVDSLWDYLAGPATVSELGSIWHKLHERIGYQVPCAFLWTPKKYAVVSRGVRVDLNFYKHNFMGMIEVWWQED